MPARPTPEEWRVGQRVTVFHCVCIIRAVYPRRQELSVMPGIGTPKANEYTIVKMNTVEPYLSPGEIDALNSARAARTAKRAANKRKAAAVQAEKAAQRQAYAEETRHAPSR